MDNHDVMGDDGFFDEIMRLTEEDWNLTENFLGTSSDERFVFSIISFSYFLFINLYMCPCYTCTFPIIFICLCLLFFIFHYRSSASTAYCVGN